MARGTAWAGRDNTGAWQSYVSDTGGDPNWNQYATGYGNAPARGWSTAYNRGDPDPSWAPQTDRNPAFYRSRHAGPGGYTGYMVEAPDAWRLPGTGDFADHDFMTRWSVKTAGGGYGYGQGFTDISNLNRRGNVWGYTKEQPYAPGIRSSDWFTDVDPTTVERADYTTGEMRIADPSSSVVETDRGRKNIRGVRNPYAGGRDNRETHAAREVIDWDAYDRKYGDWLASEGRKQFKTLEDIKSALAYERKGAVANAWDQEKAGYLAQIEALKARNELRDLEQPQRLDVSDAPAPVGGVADAAPAPAPAAAPAGGGGGGGGFGGFGGGGGGGGGGYGGVPGFGGTGDMFAKGVKHALLVRDPNARYASGARGAFNRKGMRIGGLNV